MKINVGVFFGGKSVEHEVSIITAVEAMNAMDSSKYKIIPIYITKEGEFYTGKDMLDIRSYRNIPELLDKSTNVNISLNEKEHVIVNNESGLFMKRIIDKIDVAFPIMHGTNGEDGTIQGVFELMNIPYVGCNIFASSMGMDKIASKMIFKESGLPVVDYLWFYTSTYFDEKERILASIKDAIGFPMIVKPSNLGSSVGISTANNIEELEEAIDNATSFSQRILVEKMVQNLKEINCSVLGDYSENYVSICEEPLRSGDILSYSDKYGTGSKSGMANAFHKMPAEISDELANKIKKLAKLTFVTLNASGVARVDFLVNEKTEEVYVNEINTIPGSLSFYFWEASGIKYADLLDKLIEFAIKKHREKNKLIFTNNVNILSIKGKSGETSEPIEVSSDEDDKYDSMEKVIKEKPKASEESSKKDETDDEKEQDEKISVDVKKNKPKENKIIAVTELVKEKVKGAMKSVEKDEAAGAKDREEDEKLLKESAMDAFFDDEKKDNSKDSSNENKD